MSRQKTAQTQRSSRTSQLSAFDQDTVSLWFCVSALQNCRERAGTAPLCPYGVNVWWECSLRKHMETWNWGKAHRTTLLSCWPCPGDSRDRFCDVTNTQLMVLGLLPALLLWKAKPDSNQPQLGCSRLRAKGQALGIPALQFTVRAGGKEFLQRFLHSTQRNKI